MWKFLFTIISVSTFISKSKKMINKLNDNFKFQNDDKAKYPSSSLIEDNNTKTPSLLEKVFLIDNLEIY